MKKNIKFNFLSQLNLLNKSNQTIIPSKLRVGEIYIEKLKPLGGMFKPGITKAGRVSLSGFLNDGTKVKVYNSYNSEQIRLRKNLDLHFKNENVLFSPVITSDEFFVVEKWIKGKSFSDLQPKALDKYSIELINFLNKIHNESLFIKLARENKNSFCYIRNYLLMRLKPWEQWIPVEKLVKAWHKSDLETESKIATKISHPDLSLSNLIVDSDDRIYIVDNELIGVGKGWILDKKNSFFRMKVPPLKIDHISQNFFNLSWKLRLVGSAIDSGDFERAERMSKLI